MRRSPVPPPAFAGLLAAAQRNGRLATVLARLPRDVERRPYLHWDTFQYCASPPDDLTKREWWLAHQIARRAARRWLPLETADGRSFGYCLTDAVLRACQTLDRRRVSASRSPGMRDATATLHTERDRYVLRSLIEEEAIASSQFEGAATTRAVAQVMLRESRPPRDVDERAVLNNVNAMAWIRASKGRALGLPMILELHRMLTEGTLDSPEHAGRLRSNDNIVVAIGAEVAHQPPPAAALEGRLAALCRFANARDGVDRALDIPFIPPVVQAIVLHFQLAYEHPFVDGNGRTARALFYWSMLRNGYAFAEMVSISRILKRRRRDYERAFLQTETDDGDLTYFVEHQIAVILEAVSELDAYLARKAAERRALDLELRAEAGLNPRQKSLIRYARRHPAVTFTIAQHQTTYGVSYLTARSDLQALAARGLLQQWKVGRRLTYRAVTA